MINRGGVFGPLKQVGSFKVLGFLKLYTEQNSSM